MRVSPTEVTIVPVVTSEEFCDAAYPFPFFPLSHHPGFLCFFFSVCKYVLTGLFGARECEFISTCEWCLEARTTFSLGQFLPLYMHTDVVENIGQSDVKLD